MHLRANGLPKGPLTKNKSPHDGQREKLHRAVAIPIIKNPATRTTPTNASLLSLSALLTKAARKKPTNVPNQQNKANRRRARGLDLEFAISEKILCRPTRCVAMVLSNVGCDVVYIGVSGRANAQRVLHDFLIFTCCLIRALFFRVKCPRLSEIGSPLSSPSINFAAKASLTSRCCRIRESFIVTSCHSIRFTDYLHQITTYNVNEARAQGGATCGKISKNQFDSDITSHYVVRRYVRLDEVEHADS